MDDRTKLRIRAEFNARFWRLIIGTVLLSGLLFWLWFAWDRPQHFYWLTLLPLLFIAPIVRYHLIIRSLTSSESSAAPQAAIAGIADELTKSRIRRRAKVALAIADLLLVFLLVGSIGVGLGRASGKKADLEYELQNTKYALLRAFTDFEDQNVREVALFTPPTAPADYPLWAAQIRDHMQQPVAVFLRDGRHTTWIRRPAEFSILDSLFEARFIESESKAPKEWSLDTLGSTVFRRFSYGERSDPMFNAVMVYQRDDAEPRWGIVYRREHAWRPFFERLKAVVEPKQNELPDALVGRAENIIQVRRILVMDKESSMLPVLRASLEGAELFRSPGFDTTGVSYIDSLAMARVEFYSSRLDNVMMEALSTDQIPWGRVAIIVITLSVLHLCWLWIRKLTAPTASVS